VFVASSSFYYLIYSPISTIFHDHFSTTFTYFISPCLYLLYFSFFVEMSPNSRYLRNAIYCLIITVTYFLHSSSLRFLFYWNQSHSNNDSLSFYDNDLHCLFYHHPICYLFHFFNYHAGASSNLISTFPLCLVNCDIFSTFKSCYYIIFQFIFCNGNPQDKEFCFCCGLDSFLLTNDVALKDLLPPLTF